jgi:hypothetical protein
LASASLPLLVGVGSPSLPLLAVRGGRRQMESPAQTAGLFILEGEGASILPGGTGFVGEAPSAVPRLNSRGRAQSEAMKVIAAR